MVTPTVRGTMYGPAIRGTMKVDGEAAAVLAALRAPEMPRAVVAAPIVVRRMSRLAIAGLVLAIVASPIGLVVSVIALGNLLSGRWRGRGENVALAGVVASVLMMTALVALLIG